MVKDLRQILIDSLRDWSNNEYIDMQSAFSEMESSICLPIDDWYSEIENLHKAKKKYKIFSFKERLKSEAKEWVIIIQKTEFEIETALEMIFIMADALTNYAKIGCQSSKKEKRSVGWFSTN